MSTPSAGTPSPASIVVTIEVGVDPDAAFAIFTEEIGQWWRAGPINWNDNRHAVGIRIEPGVGGRWIEVTDAQTGEGFEAGRISVWEPGARLAFAYRDAGHRIDGTQVEVRFEPVPGGTRVTLEHSGWDLVSPDVAATARQAKRYGWANILLWYSEWAFWGSPRRVAQSALAASSREAQTH
jgi:hypothetical protein